MRPDDAVLFQAAPRLPRLILGVVAMAATLAFAWSTDHVWEDFYITYKSSRNLAEGSGLVFMPGEKVHTFTSPLGVLLPALALKLSGGSDAGAIWIFRFWSAAAFGGAVALVFAAAHRADFGRIGALVAGGWLLLDAKSLDFTINGMETGFVLCFLGYTLWALFTASPRRWIHLGLGWAGMMWSRPDSFLYIGLSAFAVWAWNDAARSRTTRREFFITFLKAGALCTLLYLPWFAWSAWYYGTPVPHTIIAKGNVAPETKTFLGAVRTAVELPVRVWRGTTSLESTFLPSYFQLGGWPQGFVTGARVLGLGLALVWLVPLFRRETRAVSFVFFGAHVYLSHYPFFPFPWYLPATTLLAALVLGGIAGQFAAWCRGLSMAGRRPVLAVACGTVALTVLLGGEAWLTWQMRRQMAVEQRLSATGVRMAVGKWLRENSSPGQTVFMEPLGHIGYFSRLKTLDFPGLSSPEMVRAVDVVGPDWAFLAEYLSPDWIVLRPWEVTRMNATFFGLLNGTYRLAKEFNTLAQVAESDIHGRPYVAHDAHLLVYRRVAPPRFQIDAKAGPTPQFPLPIERFDGAPPMYKLHAPGLLSFRTPEGARRVRFAYGLPPATYEGPLVTDGAHFQLWVVDRDHVSDRIGRQLNPVKVESDRGVQFFEKDLPPVPGGAEVVIMVLSDGTNHMDWCCWSWPEFTF